MPEVAISQGAPAPLSQVDFRKRILFAEKVAIEQAAASDAEVRVVMGDLSATPIVHLDDPLTIAGMDLLVSKSLLTSERRDEILNG